MDDKQLQKMINSNWTLRQYQLTKEKVEEYAGYAVGDFVTEKHDNGHYVENIKGSGLKARFKIVHKDPASGLTFAQRVNMNGKLGHVFCLEGRINSTFELDPNYLTSQLINDEFDPNQELQEAQKRVQAIKKANAKLFKGFSSAFGLKEYLDANFKPGLTFWLAYRFHGNSRFYGPYVVQKLVKTKMATGAHSWHQFTSQTGYSYTVECLREDGFVSKWTADDILDNYKISESAPLNIKIVE